MKGFNLTEMCICTAWWAGSYHIGLNKTKASPTISEQSAATCMGHTSACQWSQHLSSASASSAPSRQHKVCKETPGPHKPECTVCAAQIMGAGIQSVSQLDLLRNQHPQLCCVQRLDRHTGDCLLDTGFLFARSKPLPTGIPGKGHWTGMQLACTH